MTKNKKEDLEKEETKTCFFITPIGSVDSIEFKKMTALLENVINPVLDDFDYESVVAHKIQQIGSIGDQVFQSIMDASLIISNLTGLNPNVMYETAVAHSFGKPTIMMVENDGVTKLPFDIVADRAIFFDDSIAGSGDLREELTTKITHIEKEETVDNPVLRVLERTATLDQISGSDDIQAQMYRMIIDIQENTKPTHKKEELKKISAESSYFSKISITFYATTLSEENGNNIVNELIKKITYILDYKWSKNFGKLLITVGTHPNEEFARIKADIAQALSQILSENSSVKIRKVVRTKKFVEY